MAAILSRGRWGNILYILYNFFFMEINPSGAEEVIFSYHYWDSHDTDERKGFNCQHNLRGE